MLTLDTSPHGIGLGSNYVTGSVENTKSVPSYNTGLMVNNINASTSEPLHKIISYKESHNSSFDNSNNEFEKFIQFTRIDEILNKLEALAVSNNGLANEIKHSNQVLADQIVNSNHVLADQIVNSNQLLANQIKNAITVMNDSVMNQTELTSSIKSLIQELTKNNN